MAHPNCLRQADVQGVLRYGMADRLGAAVRGVEPMVQTTSDPTLVVIGNLIVCAMPLCSRPSLPM